MKRGWSSTSLSKLSLSLAGWSVAALSIPALGQPVPLEQVHDLAGRLEKIHGEVIGLEEHLITNLKTQKRAQSNLKYIRALLKLQQEERDLGKKRIVELESTLQELESRRNVLKENIAVHRKSVHHLLVSIEKATQRAGLERIPRDQLSGFEVKFEAPRRKVLANLIERGLKEMEVMKIDLGDAEMLEARIQDEKHQLAFLFQDLDEREGVLKLNQELQLNLLRKNQEDRIAQLESYQKLKSAEGQVQQLINALNARKELERTSEEERRGGFSIVKTRSREEIGQERVVALHQSPFFASKGKLPLPLAGGKILSSFGKTYDPHSRLYIFKKGIDIASQKNEPVRAISSGKIAFSGELPSYGRVTIVDHGDHFYSLCAHLGALGKKAGDSVVAGEVLGSADHLGTPVYFEIRARNVAVNPLQWVSN